LQKLEDSKGKKVAGHTKEEFTAERPKEAKTDEPPKVRLSNLSGVR